MINVLKADIFKDLQTDILRLQGFKTVNNKVLDVGLGPIRDALPNGSFPLGAVHEFVSSRVEDAACTHGFVATLLASLMGSSGVTLWVSATRKLFPPALSRFGLAPDRFIFIDLQKEKDVMWVMDEALKCNALTAVVGEVCDIDFTASRRLQLAVEKSQVTGFILRSDYRSQHATACVSRWRITSLPSASADDLPGIGFPNWRVELLRMRNGKSGVWSVQCIDGRFVSVYNSSGIQVQRMKAG